MLTWLRTSPESVRHTDQKAKTGVRQPKTGAAASQRKMEKDQRVDRKTLYPTTIIREEDSSQEVSLGDLNDDAE